MNFIKILISFKETKFWFIFLKYLIAPVYNFIWEYLINFKGKLLYKKFKKKKIKSVYKIYGDIPSLLIKNDNDFHQIATKISKSIDLDFLKKKMEDLKKDNSITRNRNYIFEFFPFLKDNLKEEIINFAKSEKNLAIVSDYLKVFPVIGKIHVYLNFPVDNETERASMLWHKDDFGYKSLDFFITITELTSENGSMFFLNVKDSLNIFRRVPEIIQDAKPKEKNKIKIDDFNKYYNQDKISEFTGNIGDALLIDSFRVYHRGGYCKKNIRIMLRISYQTPDASRLLNFNEENFEYNNKIKKNDLVDEHEKYLFFGSNVFKNHQILIKNLLFFYRLIHLKSKKIFQKK
jgi:hypothetical protein